MDPFFTNNDEAFLDLENRARYGCIRFQNMKMPPGCNPKTADVGFEIGDTALFWVTAGVRYSGSSIEVHEWLGAGVKQFSTFQDLRDWIQGPLKEAYVSEFDSTITEVPNDQVHGPGSELTDMAAVRKEICEMDQPLYINETDLFNQLCTHIRGQDGALKTLAAVLTRHLARLRPSRPAVVFAIGPSGVGKTRTAEVVPKVFRNLGDENNTYSFLRLDMTEYQESHRVSQLIGSPQGYAGHDEGSQLINALRKNPRTIVLFDEIEKAHPAILRVLMNAMDAGRLSTASRTSEGHEVDCRSAIFIFTSNLDATEILAELETRDSFGIRAVEDEVCRRRLHAAGVAPEIVGRIGRFLVYRPLSAETRAEILALAIVEIAEEYGVQVKYIEPGVIVALIQISGSQNFGVRPERFLIDDLLGSSFAMAAQKDISKSVAVIGGPPYECVPHRIT